MPMLIYFQEQHFGLLILTSSMLAAVIEMHRRLTTSVAVLWPGARGVQNDDVDADSAAAAASSSWSWFMQMIFYQWKWEVGD